MTRAELTKRAKALLLRAGFDSFTGAKKDKHYRRQKRAEAKVARRHRRARQQEYGKLGPASPGRVIAPATREEDQSR